MAELGWYSISEIRDLIREHGFDALVTSRVAEKYVYRVRLSPDTPTSSAEIARHNIARTLEFEPFDVSEITPFDVQECTDDALLEELAKKLETQLSATSSTPMFQTTVFLINATRMSKADVTSSPLFRRLAAICNETTVTNHSSQIALYALPRRYYRHAELYEVVTSPDTSSRARQAMLTGFWDHPDDSVFEKVFNLITQKLSEVQPDEVPIFLASINAGYLFQQLGTREYGLSEDQRRIWSTVRSRHPETSEYYAAITSLVDPPSKARLSASRRR